MTAAVLTLTITIPRDLVEAKLDEFPEQLGNWPAECVPRTSRPGST